MSFAFNSLPILEQKPKIDGARDDFLNELSPLSFAQIYTFDNIYATDDIRVTYNIALHQDGLYVLIETNAAAVSYHKRGFVYGDGFKLIIGQNTPFGRSDEYTELSYSPTNLEEDRPLAQYISSYNSNNVGRRLSNLSSHSA